MKKRESVKVMRLAWFTAATLICICSGCNNSTDTGEGNFFRTNEARFLLDNCTLTMLPGNGMLQCEIDLSCCNIGNPYIPTDQIATRNFIWLSLRYRDENDLGEGFFICSEKRNKLRLPMSFSGTVTENGTETKIRSGKVVVNKDQAEVRLSFELRLENNRRISGRYSGPFARNIIHN